MNGNVIRRALLVCLLLSVIAVERASAQAARVFLSGTGSDVGDCSNAATPCRSLQGAVDQTAAGGDVIIVSSGGFGGATITKSITVNAPAGVVAFIGRTITVTIGSADSVVLRGLSLNGRLGGFGDGIAFTSGGRLLVENCLITGFYAGIRATAPGARLWVSNCDIRSNPGSGIIAGNGAAGLAPMRVAIDKCRFIGNDIWGVVASDDISVSIRNSVAEDNPFAFELHLIHAGETGEMNIESCQVSKSLRGISADGVPGVTQIIRVSQTTIMNNGKALFPSFGQIISFGNNRVAGNAEAAFDSFSSTVALK